MSHSNYQKAAWLLFLFVSLVSLGACSDKTAEYFKFSGQTMGTRYNITVLENSEVDTQREDVKQAVERQLQLINQQMSTYQQDSELSRLNASPVNQWLSVSPDLFTVLMLSLELGWLSNGAFDITVGPLVALWGFGPTVKMGLDTVPAADKIAMLKRLIGFENIEFNLVSHEIRKRQGVAMDLSGIAKGYAVDKVAELLAYAGYTDFMVEIGGELRLQGNNPRGTAWRIAIEQPDDSLVGQVQQAISVSGVGMATSGDYRNYFEYDGRRYSHTIDPNTGYPVTHKLASVTVVADSSAYADGLATAISVLGADKGLQLAQQQNLAIYMIIKTEQGFEVVYSDAFKPYLN